MGDTFRGKSLASWLKSPEIVVQLLGSDQETPNNPRLPVMLYKQAVILPEEDPAALFESLFAANGWGDGWRNGIFPYHHFHCTAHEALGIFSGSATVQLGGADGITVEVEAGDVAVLPAGVCHKRLDSRPSLGVVGAYPKGQDPDRCEPDSSQLTDYLARIAVVANPTSDPAFGADGPLVEHWGS